MIKEIIDYLKLFEGFKGKEIIIDYMPSQTGTFCLKSSKFDPVYRKFVDGGCIKQHKCTLCMREAYTFDNNLNSQNTKFLEDFIKWLEIQEKDKVYPENHNFFQVDAISGIYIVSNDVSTAEYAVDLRFLYKE